MKFSTIAFLAGVLAISSCKTGSKVANNTTEGNKAHKKLACADVHVDINTPHLDWMIENNSTLNKSLAKMTNVIVLPKDYAAYSIDSAQLTNFFTAINQGERLQTSVPLPKPAGCQVFTLHNNIPEGTHVPGGMVAAVGDAMNQKLSASLYNGNLTAHINWFDIMYEVMTINTPDGDYIIIYAKQPPPENKNIEKDPAKYTPQIQEIRYDK